MRVPSSIWRLVVVVVAAGVWTASAHADTEGATSPAANDPRAALRALAKCTITPASGAPVRARCGEVAVPERADGKGPTIPIGFAVLPATGDDAKPDPIVLLAGGPGQSATRDMIGLGQTLSSWRRDRDLIFVDIRGTGRSKPQRCVDPRDAVAQMQDEGDDVDAKARRAALRKACVDAMTIDPRHITSADAARDVDAVRVALGIEQWNVYGVSYGTRLAVVYDHAFPGRARTLVLDGVVGHDVALGGEIATDMTSAIKALNTRSPGFIDNLRNLRATLDAHPATVRARHPTTGAQREVVFTGRMLNGIVRFMLYSDTMVATLPQLLRDAAQGQLETLAGIALQMHDALDDAIHGPVNASILCAEDVPFLDNLPRTDLLLDDERPRLREACDGWPHADVVAPSARAFVPSTPTLLLSGGADPITPPRHADKLAALVPDHAHLIARGVGHNVIAAGCIVDVAEAFIEAGTARGLDATCVDRIRPFPVFVDGAGPAP